jgi:hypothetical protein
VSLPFIVQRPGQSVTHEIALAEHHDAAAARTRTTLWFQSSPVPVCQTRVVS